MKLILAAFAAFFSSVTYAAVMVMPLNPDVVILIGNKPCKDGLMAAAVRTDKMYIPGCASFVQKGTEGYVHIQWEKGDFSEFPTKFFHAE